MPLYYLLGIGLVACCVACRVVCEVIAWRIRRGNAKLRKQIVELDQSNRSLVLRQAERRGASK